MPNVLFCINDLGKVCCLPTRASQWQPMSHPGLEFKRISASQNILYAIGCNQQIYVYVYGLASPIRIKVDTYENQRWNPLGGFCSKLLVTDRPHLSSQDGTIEKQFHNICLPSLGWQWEGGDWKIDDTLDGEFLEAEGWTYAVDFPAQFRAKKWFGSCVRRRRWVRYRRYVAVGAWTSVPPIMEPNDERFVDVSVGGADLPVQMDTLMVWAVTSRGRVLFRTGVGSLSPEGTSWLHVPTPQGSEASRVSCGLSGLTWAVTWQGDALVRTGISHEAPQGTDWCPVLPPDGVQLQEVSVGDDCVWAVSRDRRIFFRNGIRGHEMCANTTMARGTGWLEMVGSMAAVSVGLNNQVITLDEDGKLHLRSHVTSAELTGREWLPLHVEMPAASSLSASSLSLLETDGAGGGPVGAECLAAPRRHSAASSGSGDTTSRDLDGSFALDTGSDTASWCCVAAGDCSLDPLHLPPWFSASSGAEPHQKLWRQELIEKLHVRNDQLRPYDVYEEAVDRSSCWVRTAKCRWLSDVARTTWVAAVLELEQSGAAGNVDWAALNVYTSGAKAASISLSEVTCVIHGSGSPRPTLLLIYTPQERLPMQLSFSEEDEAEHWRDMIQTACLRLRRIDGGPSAAALWVTSERGDVLVSDQRLTVAEVEMARETRESLCRRQLLPVTGRHSMPFVYQLERGFTDSCIICIQYSLPTTCSRFSVNLTTGNMNGDQNTDIAFHYNPRLQLEKLVCNSKLKQEWGREEVTEEQPFSRGQQGELHLICHQEHIKVLAVGDCTLYNHRVDCRRISHLAIDGDIGISQVFYDATMAPAAPLELFWRRVAGHLRRVEVASCGIVWGLGYDKTPWVYMGSATAGAITERGGSGVVNDMSDIRYFYIYENQRWTPLAGFSYHGVHTDRPTWSDETGRIAMNKDTVLPPSRHWSWVSSWTVDFHTEGGVDDEGWQYAIDFPASYHKACSVVDCVRRRLWYRRCRLTISGPWQEVENIKLRDISMQARAGRTSSHLADGN